MQFVRSADTNSVIAALSEALLSALQADRRTMWLISGGSNIQIAVAVMNRIPEALSAHLVVTLTDERYGVPGHKDSNWQQLLEAGFTPRAAQCFPVLTHEAELEAARMEFEVTLTRLLEECEVVIGQFGMGSDGHIAGILPDSPAVVASGLVAAYVSDPFRRITLTFEAIKHCQTAFLAAFGADKRSALERLQTDVPLSEQPAQVLKQISAAYVYNDQIGEPS